MPPERKHGRDCSATPPVHRERVGRPWGSPWSEALPGASWRGNAGHCGFSLARKESVMPDQSPMEALKRRVRWWMTAAVVTWVVLGLVVVAGGSALWLWRDAALRLQVER